MEVLARPARSFNGALTLDAGEQVRIEPHPNDLLVKVFVSRWRAEQPDREQANWYLLPKDNEYVWYAFLREDIILEDPAPQRRADRYPRNQSKRGR